MIASQRYNRPPIIEAVIDLGFEGNLSDRELERLRGRFKAKYPSIEERKNIQIEVRADQIITNPISAGFKMAAENASDLILINPNSFGSVRLAPYENWENLLSATKENFDLFTKIVGRKKIERLGVRYINRFDIPSAKIEGGPLSQFVRLGIAFPMEVSSVVGGFSLTFNGIEISTGAKLTIDSGVIAPPALLEHISISLDIDVYWDADIPTRLEDMWAKTEVLRHAKNAVFEGCITDELRALFQ
jgi:uncharacterized protein (TIGR04255 family)